MKSKILRFFLPLPLLLTLACAHRQYTPDEIEAESKRINAFFARKFKESVARHPEFATHLGLKENYDQLDDESEAASLKEHELDKQALKELKEFDYHALDEQSQISYRMFEWNLKNDIDTFKFRHHNYPVNQMWGAHSDLPSFMMNMHTVKSVSDAEAYIARLNGFQKKFDQIIEGMKIREKKGIIPPDFTYERVLPSIKNVLNGAPFSRSIHKSPIYADIHKKIADLKTSSSVKSRLRKEAKEALIHSVQPAYEKLHAYYASLRKKAPKDAGAWKLPNGKEFYQTQLKFHTSSDMSADEVHQLGLNEVARIHDEIRVIMKKVGFEGDLEAFFKFMGSSKKFKYPATPAGRKAYLRDAKGIIDKMEDQLGKLFSIKPKAPMVVKAVEPYREKSAGGAFYEQPSTDGKRPGIYYVNLYNVSAANKYEMEALAYHEGIPGHHMQIATSIELESLPEFRKHSWITAYGEGWALYAEMIPKEVGFYQDPYSDFGRLTMELWRACRLVVDTGIHHKRWTYEQAVQYLVDNTPADRAESVNSINRYTVWPGQATAYKSGMIKIQELRKRSKELLGKKFKIQEFHDEVLRNGAMPMDLLEERVMLWANRKMGNGNS